MKKRRWIIWLAVAFTAVLAAVWLDPTYILLGLLKNEPFYRGRPSSYWRTKVHRIMIGGSEDRIRAHEEIRGLEPAWGEAMDPATIPVLVKLLDDQDDQVRFFACNSLGALGSQAATAVPALLRMLRQNGLYQRRHAVHTLAAIGSSAEPAIPDLIQALDDEDAWVNYFAAAALGRIGPGAREAIPALRELLKSDRANEFYLGPGSKDTFNPGMDKVGEVASWALKEIDPEAAQGEDS